MKRLFELLFLFKIQKRDANNECYTTASWSIIATIGTIITINDTTICKQYSRAERWQPGRPQRWTCGGSIVARSSGWSDH
jgi:hypothetical protein